MSEQRAEFTIKIGAALFFGSLAAYFGFRAWEGWDRSNLWPLTVVAAFAGLLGLFALGALAAATEHLPSLLRNDGGDTDANGRLTMIRSSIENRSAPAASMQSSSESRAIVSAAAVATPVRAQPSEKGFDLISARDSYQSKRQTATLAVWLSIAVSSLVAIVLFAVSPSLGLAATALLAAACWGVHAAVKTFLLERPARLFCPACDKFLPSDLSWTCAKCGNTHSNSHRNSFLNHCQRCGTSPPAYQCHHPDCEETIFLNAKYDSNFCAYGVGKENPNMNRRREREEELAEKRHTQELRSIDISGARQIMDMHDLVERWERAHTPLPRRIEKSIGQLIEEEWSKHHQSIYELKSYTAKLRETAKGTHRDDPNGLQEAEADIDDFYEKMLRKFQRRGE